MPAEIRFFRFYERNGFLSNFYPSPIEIDGKVWPTVEHYFQAAKFPDYPAYQQRVREARTPDDAKRLGGTRHLPILRDWDSRRVPIMINALIAKFTGHEELREALLATGDAALIEANPHDPYWGSGRQGSGQNMLGKLLMELRASLT
ncbi:MAG: NADAR family protein [Candidatus Sungbacteria bacterium]|nr:NADAR family protein [Candidatus Sungbacteria bacterium]